MRIANCRCPSHHSQLSGEWGKLIDAQLFNDKFIVSLILVNFTGLPFTARPFRMALVLLNAQIAHRTRTIAIGPADCGKHIARQWLRGEIEIIHLRFDCGCCSKIQQGNCESTALEAEFFYDIEFWFQLHFSELPSKTPFVCVCIKEVWLMIQLLIEKLHENGGQLNTFWFYFGDVLKQFRDRKSKCGRLTCSMFG